MHHVKCEFQDGKIICRHVEHAAKPYEATRPIAVFLSQGAQGRGEPDFVIGPPGPLRSLQADIYQDLLRLRIGRGDKSLYTSTEPTQDGEAPTKRRMSVATSRPRTNNNSIDIQY